MKKQLNKRVAVAALILSCASSAALAEGHLLAVGGMLRASNSPVYAKFIELAGWPERGAHRDHANRQR